MNLNITTKNFELSEALSSYIEKRLDVLEKYSNHIISAELSMEEQRGRYTGTLAVKVKGRMLTAKSTQNDPYAVIDEIKDKIKNQIIKYEEKLQGK